MCHTIKLTIETNLPPTIQCKCGGEETVNMAATSTTCSNLSSIKKMNTSMLWPMTRVYSRFCGCDA